MARNEEKAQSMLNRFRALQQAELKGPKPKRPFYATDCNSIGEAEKWRLEVMSEVSKKVSQIQNAALGEFKLRDLNDEINKLLREKRHWQDRIIELGGKDYFKIGPRMLDHEGKEVPGARGYKYFGAAKDLPGVRELFAAATTQTTRRTRAELHKDVDADYYGYRDDDDGTLIPLEQEAEAQAIAEAVQQWEAKNNQRATAMAIDNEDDDDNDDTNIYKQAVASGSMFGKAGAEDDELDGALDSRKPEVFVAHVAVPTQADVEKLLVERKKQELLQRFAAKS
ncbi:pre-mRNA-splicing factor ISY1 [Capsaspora owczarzaki ATCC 30864]|uniref:pre-mRNA-splicing factor ISY1 n=1 Tax=Capsaspora owczarzaki (strain ATCC 30864) TaxID=595528 RepID=UPI0003524E68|nr:pre-mRNA-splicing factor ISY1 [Capsaspora owczarzaki ATCC 30864]|eukprot:XP_004349130.2 pre-mRNA-splicing factor ISY1 [Capsaspora owczarzaki ATCC 30864]